MSVKKRYERFLKKYGEKAVVLLSDEPNEVYALIQPMRYKNKLYIEKTRTALGFKDSECFLYLGPAYPDFSGLELQTTVKSRDKVYSVSRADIVTLGGEKIYIWAVLVPKTMKEENDGL